MSVAVGYARVSTMGQSLAIQLDHLKEAGVKKVFQEKASGVKVDRPQLEALLDFVREGDSVTVTKLDRIARSTRHLLEIVDQLKAKGVTFRVLNMNLDTSTPTGKLMLTMLAGIAEFERGLMLERQKEGIAMAKETGRYKGRKPTAKAKSSQVIKLDKEGLTKQAIAEELNIGVASVYRILKVSKTVAIP